MPKFLFVFLSLIFWASSPVLLTACGTGADESNLVQEAGEENYPELSEMIGQMMMVGFRGFTVEETDRIAEDIRERNLGGIILFDYDVPSGTPQRNVSSPAQLKTLIENLQSFAETPLLIAIDQEGGRVNRLKTRNGFPAVVSHEHLGKLNSADSTRAHARKMAQTLADLGINVNFAPVVDLNSNPQNPVIGRLGRSFSADADKVIMHSRIFLEEFSRAGLAGTIKHFPGHGSAWNDSHFGLADVTETWDEAELEPYRVLIQEGKATMVMSAHIVHQKWSEEHPATLLPEIMTGLLRDELGFEGLLFSDDMQMGAITDFYGLEQALVLAVLAGIDVLVFANNSVHEPEITARAIEIIGRNVRNGIIPENTIRESYDRIMRHKSTFHQN
ncbi:MAG: glycoside hydrolase family 3 [Balneolales bacterium]|nr:glycoside hydrolase family 3 [Balneolales bacterium]